MRAPLATRPGPRCVHGQFRRNPADYVAHLARYRLVDDDVFVCGSSAGLT